MSEKWKCPSCDWKGDNPLKCSPYEGIGYFACPKGCKGNFDHEGNRVDDEPTAVLLTLANEENLRLMFDALDRGNCISREEAEKMVRGTD